MPPGTTWTRPEGGFYVWLKLPHGLDAKLMQPRAVAAHVAYVPGIGFFADGNGREYMRLRSEEHTSELQSRQYLVCRLLLEKKKQILYTNNASTRHVPPTPATARP